MGVHYNYNICILIILYVVIMFETIDGTAEEERGLGGDDLELFLRAG